MLLFFDTTVLFPFNRMFTLVLFMACVVERRTSESQMCEDDRSCNQSLIRIVARQSSSL